MKIGLAASVHALISVSASSSFSNAAVCEPPDEPRLRDGHWSVGIPTPKETTLIPIGPSIYFRRRFFTDFVGFATAVGRCTGGTTASGIRGRPRFRDSFVDGTSNKAAKGTPKPRASTSSVAIVRFRRPASVAW